MELDRGGALSKNTELVNLLNVFSCFVGGLFCTMTLPFRTTNASNVLTDI